MNVSPSSHRPVRSYVLRQGRISRAQLHYLQEGQTRWGIPYSPQPLNLDRIFGRAAPCIVEVGCGMGETTAAIAEAHPQHNYLGIEVHNPGVGALFKEIAVRGLSNLRVIQHDAVEVMQHMITANTLTALHIYFPDPWPKKRHHKRRLIQPEFVSLLASRLCAGGYIHCATDWQDYALHILDVLTNESLLTNSSPQGFVSRPQWRPLTKFEQRGMRLGHQVWDVIFTRS